LQNKKDMRRRLFLEVVEKKCVHYTGNIYVSASRLNARIKPLIFCVVGLDITIVRALHNLVKRKAARLHMWKGKKNTRTYNTNRYLKVGIINISKRTGTFQPRQVGFMW
jgi:hypothetical protein